MNLKLKNPKDLIKHGLSYDDFLKKYDIGKIQAKKCIEKLENNGFQVAEIKYDSGILFKISTEFKGENNVSKISFDGEYNFAIISDTHFNSRFQKLEELGMMYDEVAERGISHVYHAGDLWDGLPIHYEKNVDVQEEINEQLEKIALNYPKKKNVFTKYIGGNHDLKMVTKIGMDCCQALNLKREDLEYLGQNKTSIIANDFFIAMEHFQKKLKRGIDNRGKSFLNNFSFLTPDLVILGHKHMHESYKIGNTLFIEGGCFQELAQGLKSNDFKENIGGWIINIRKSPDGEKKIVYEKIDFSRIE